MAQPKTNTKKRLIWGGAKARDEDYVQDTESERWSFEVTEMDLSGLHVTRVTESAQSRPAGEDAGRASEDSAVAGNLGSERARCHPWTPLLCPF